MYNFGKTLYFYKFSCADYILPILLSWANSLATFWQTISIHCISSNSTSVQSFLTLQTHRLYSTRFLCPWNSPDKNTGVCCHSLLQGIFPTQGSNLGLPHCKQILFCLSHQVNLYCIIISHIFTTQLFTLIWIISFKKDFKKKETLSPLKKSLPT